MSNVVCDNCGKQMAANQAACSHCGAARKSTPDSTRQNIEWIIVAAPTAIGGLAGYFLLGPWAGAGLAVAGLVVGIGIITALYVMEHRK